MAFDTAANIINDAAVSLGLWATDYADPFVEPERLPIQLVRLLKSTGRRLVHLHAWTHLRKTHSVTTTAGVGDYALPADFARMVDQTAQSGNAPWEGPLEAASWANRRASLPGTWRILGERLHVHPVPSSAQPLSFEYVSSLWVRPSGEEAPTTDAPTAGGDTLHLERLLLVAGLKLAFLSAKGMDTTAAAQEYAEAFAAATNADPSPRLSLSGPRGVHLLDWHNVPDGDWGVP